MFCSSSIESVTVFQSGAEVTRRVTVPEEGLELPFSVSVGSLPLCLQDASVSAAVRGKKAAVETLEASVGVELSSDLPGRRKELKDCDKALDETREAVTRAHRWIEMLSEISLPSRPEAKPGEPPPPMELEVRLELLELRRNLREAWTREVEELSEQEDHLLERKSALTSDLSLDTSLAKTVTFKVGGSGRLEGGERLEFTYRVPGARWTAGYILRFDAILARVQTQLRALVAQETGEDWSEVELSVSSATLQEIREMPELRSVRIGKNQPPPPIPSWKPPPQDTESLFRDFDRKFEREKTSEPVPLAKPMSPPVSLEELSLEQQLAIVMMALPPERAADLFSQIGPDLVQSVTLEIARLPQVSASLKDKVLRRARAYDLVGDHRYSDSLTSLFCDAVVELERGAPGGGGAFSEESDDDEAEESFREVRIAAASAPMEADLVKRRISPQKKRKESFFCSRPEPKPIVKEDPLARQYSRLVMRSAQQTDRGQLQHQSLGEQVLAEAQRLGLPAEDLEAQIKEAIRRAEQVTRTSLPPGCYPPEWPGQEQFDLFYRAKTKCTVPSDGAYHGQLLFSLEGECESHYVAVPRETSQVFRAVEIVGREALPRGQADIYLDRTFLLSGPFEGLPPGGVLRMALGVEERIEIVRNTRFKESSSGMVSKTRNLEHSIEIEVKNGLRRAAEIEVRERLPQPDQLTKEVEVTVNRSMPEWEPFEPEEQTGFKGAYRWRIDLEPGEQRKMEAVYTITLPYKYELEGGNRRD